MAMMTAAAMNDLPDSAFAYIEPGGSKDEQGKTVPRSKRHFPIHDAAHVRNALARAPQSPFGDKAMPKIRAAAKKFGVEVADSERSEALEAPEAPEVPYAGGAQVFYRSFPLEDIKILTRAQGTEYADGRTVEALIAVFDRDAEIVDHEGHYLENISRTAFDKAITESRPQGSRQVWRTGVFYNHGMTLYGTPSERFSVPLGSPRDIRITDHGLLTVTRYDEIPLADEILELIRSGSITGHSFTGRIIKSDPARPPRRGGYARRNDGSLHRVRRLELGLKEYGPTPFPAYADAAVVGVRSMLPGLQWPALLSATPELTVRQLIESGLKPEEVIRMVQEMEPTDSDTSPDGEAVSDEPPTDDVEHSSRNSLLQRIAAAKTIRPGLAQPTGSDARRTKVQAITRPEGEGSE